MYVIDGVKEICYICGEVIEMAKPNIAGKLKELARDLKDDKNSGVKKLGDAVKNAEAKKKSVSNEKASGRKD